MNTNIGKVVARGEQLNTLQNKTDQLQQGAITFTVYFNTEGVENQMWWKSTKLMFIIQNISVFLLFGYFIFIIWVFLAT
jgi:vesicle-associated membrane protein 4